MERRDFEVLDGTLHNLQIELSSEKTTTRNKAFATFQDILDRRSDEINRLVNSRDYTSDTKWPSLFQSLLDGMKQHVDKIRNTAATSALENKCGMYVHVTTRLVTVANGNSDQIPKKVLLEKCLELLENNQEMDKYFGNCLLTIIDQYLVLSKKVWINIKSVSYKQYLTLLFNIVFNTGEKSDNYNFYVKCLTNAIEKGVEQLNISSTLETHLVPMLTKIQGVSRDVKMNMLKIAYLIASGTIVNKRSVTCQLLFGIAKSIFDTYNATRIRDEHRSYIIKILDLIIVADTVTDDPKALDQQSWNFLLQSCTYIVEQEIERMDRSTVAYGGASFTIDPIFIDFAAKVCALTFWDENVWVSSTGSQQPQKRMKYLGKYQALISRTEATSSNARLNRKYSWRWMLILGKVMDMHPERIENDDYEVILQLLSEFQPQIQKPEQFQGFYLACKALLSLDRTQNPEIKQKQVADYWHKIVETAARNCSSINQIHNENMMLIRLVLYFKQHKGETFIESLLDTYFTNSINRSNESIQTLITVLLTFNINVLKDPADKIEKILSYLLLKQRVNAKLSILKTEEKPKAALIARLIVLCNMYKSTVSEVVKGKWLDEAIEYGQESWLNDEYRSYTNSMNSIKDAILIQLLQKPIFDESDLCQNAEISQQSQNTQESMCVIDDISFKSFCTKIMPIESQMACSQSTEDHEDVPDLMQEKLYNISILVNAFDIFIKIQAIHLEKVTDFQLAKRIGIIVSTLEQDFDTLDGKERYSPKVEMLKRLIDIFGIGYSEAVLSVVRNIPWAKCFSWIANVIQHGITSTELDPEARWILKQLPLKILAEYLTTEGIETARVEQFFKNCLLPQMNVMSVLEPKDILVFLDLLSVLVMSKSNSEDLALDISGFTMETLKDHYPNIKLMDKFLTIMPNFFKYFKDKDNERVVEVTNMFYGFMKAAKSHYPLHIILKILELVKYYIREYPSSDSLQSFCDSLFNFTNTNCIRTRIVATQAFIYMIHPTWSKNDSRKALEEIEELFQDISKDNLTDFNTMEAPDIKASKMAISTQLYCTTICVSYQLRHKAILAFLDMCELCQPSHERELTMKEYFKLLNKAMNCNIQQIFQDDMKRLLSHCVAKNYQFPKFPYYATTAATLEDFFTLNMSTMSIAIFTSNDQMLPQLCASTNKTEEELLIEVIPDLIIEILPILSTSAESISTQKGDKARNLIEKMRKLPNYIGLLNKSLNRILELLIQRLLDNGITKNFLNTVINPGNVKDYYLSHQILSNCCEYLKCHIQNDTSKEPILVKMCDNTPYNVQKLLLSVELRLAAATAHEQKIVCLSQYIWIFEHIKIFIVQSTDVTLKDFFIMNMVHVICDQINSPIEVVSKAAFFYFKNICEELTRAESDALKPCLTFIVHSLVQNIVTTGNAEVTTFLQRVLIEKQEAFASEIILLPDFPYKLEFKALQDHIISVRNAMQQNTLMAQIEQFFNIQYMTVETLKSLHTSLSTRKAEVVEMYDMAKDIRFSDEASKSVLHRLVTKLVSIVEGLDTGKAYEASRCLGELGAANLNTLALYDQSDHTCYKTMDNKEKVINLIHHELFVCLKDAIVDKDIKLKLTANEAAFRLMQSMIGRTFLEEFPVFKSFMMYPEPRIQSILHLNNINHNFLSNIFVLNRSEDYKVWIQNVCMQLLRVFNDSTITPLVILKPDFAENLLPAIIKLCLTIDHNELLTVLNTEMQIFFHEFYETMKDSSATTKFYRDKAIVKTMLMVFECCRVQDRHRVAPRIQLDYLHLVKAAEYCSASFSCILYSQLWSSGEASKVRGHEATFYDVKKNKEICSSLRAAYSAVGIQDAKYHLLDPVRDRQQYLIANGAWEQALLEQMNFDWINANRQVLLENGFYELANQIGGPANTQGKYEMAWRLSDWSLFDENDYKDDLNGAFEKSHYEALKCLHQNDKTGIMRNVRIAREIVVEILKTTATECPKNLYRCFGLLELLQQIDDVTAVRFDKQDADTLLTKWNTSDALPQTEFKLTELKLSQRVAVLKETGVVAQRTWLRKILPKTMFEVIRTAIEAGRDNIAFKNIAAMKMAGNEIDRKHQDMMHLEDAKLNWKHNNCTLARQMLEGLTESKGCPMVMIEARFLLGYNVKSSVDDPMKTYEKFFLKAHKLTTLFAKNENKLEKLRQGIYDNDEVGKQLKAISPMFKKIAKFFDKQYFELNKYLMSPDCLKRKSVMDRQEFSIGLLEEKLKNGQLNKEEKTQLRILRVNWDTDNKRFDKYTKDRDTYLANALRYYGYACRYSDTESLHIFRIVSLFLSHKSITAVREVIVGQMEAVVPEEQENNAGLFDTLPSFMFLNILPQLSAHLYNDDERTYVDDEIYKLLKRCAVEHPYHTLNHCMSMFNSYADQSSQDKASKSDSRVRGATKLLKEIKKEYPNLAVAIDQLTTMTSVLIKLANATIRGNAGSCELTQKSGCGILALTDLTAVHCPTMDLPIMKNGGYEHVIVTIQKWNRKVEVLNGINAPKKIMCLCSDGVERVQLLKGNDDLRQDAVMQQVFNIMNTMLAQNPKSAERRLQVRTYKVIPFSRRSGMLEWCGNTVPLGNILRDCHSKYRPYDKLTPQAARERIQESTPINRLKTFNEVCQNLKPAFHHFFLAYFLTPGALFERQYAYTNSVATNSIIGYILGIGDRHVQNILLDYTSTEVVHIDFGIAFEQGKCLPTPEMVPFRLTRDMVVGMGVTGVEGVFRKSAEITMQVLRDNQHTILAILQVLLYDPLYMWTLTPEKARRTQSLDWEPDLVSNTSAERALELCKEKLNGAENGSTGLSTIEDQVDKLIQEATAPDNLYKLFHGWQAYL